MNYRATTKHIVVPRHVYHEGQLTYKHFGIFIFPVLILYVVLSFGTRREWPLVFIFPLSPDFMFPFSPNHAMDITEASGPILGPKRKAHMDETQGGVFIDKKQHLLDEEAKALGKLMADNLGSAVAAMQHHRE